MLNTARPRVFLRTSTQTQILPVEQNQGVLTSNLASRSCTWRRRPLSLWRSGERISDLAGDAAAGCLRGLRLRLYACAHG
jgi:hypothetical protein